MRRPYNNGPLSVGARHRLALFPHATMLHQRNANASPKREIAGRRMRCHTI
jgi:hypothetical protein